MYTFTVMNPGTHTIETAGSTDCFLTLFGPDNPATFITQDDDSGPGTNSRIAVNLASGVYYAQVRHYSPTETGSTAFRLETDPAFRIILDKAHPSAYTAGSTGEVRLVRGEEVGVFRVHLPKRNN
jgi:hypothetical protein